MEQSEVETLIEELETRVDRLRALYEQYFIGIERLEPGVPRKDVERRFFVLRRTQIRNTALRFRFQNVLLRYNTYQTYWIRICRQIEEGTYKRDVRRANARFASALVPSPSEEIGVDDIEEVHDTAPPSTFELDLDFDVDDFADAEAPVATRPLAVPATLPDVPITKLPPAAPPPRPPPPALPKGRLQIPATPTERQVPFGLPIVGGAQPAKAPILSRAPPLPPRPGPPAPVHPPRVAPPSPAPIHRPPPSSRPRPTPPADPPVGVRRKSRQSMPKVEAPKAPSPPRPAVAASPSLPKPAPKSELSDDRLRQIYRQYVDAKRSHKESTASLTFDNLAKSLRESSDKLQEKHAGKKVDFEVTVKNGKTILRPVVK